MNYNPQFDSQRAFNNPALYNYPANVINDSGTVVGNTFPTNDPSALCLSGNAYSIKMKGD